MPIQICDITTADIPGAVDCIQRAFADDPYHRWVFHPVDQFSLARNTHSLSIRIRWGMEHAMFHVAKDTSSAEPETVLGVACWLRPSNTNVAQSWHDYFGDWWLWWEQVKMNLWHGRGGLNTKRYYIWKAAQAQAQKALWTDEKGYYFCNIVTVCPEAQGTGVGKLLFKHVTDKADIEGRKCYLESSRAEPNMAIYERMGFTLGKEMICDDSGDAITLYCMMREPQTA